MFLVSCGIIDKKYDEALYWTFHSSLDERKTNCGFRCNKETKSTIWRFEGQLRNKEDVTCNRCRRILGLSPLKQSRILR